MKKLCRFCQHWREEADSPDWDKSGNYRYCNLTDWDWRREEGSKALMYAEVDQGDYPTIYPAIKTREDFGCTEFENLELQT